MITIAKKGSGFDNIWIYINGELKSTHNPIYDHYIYKKRIIKRINTNELENQYKFDGEIVKRVLKNKLSDEYIFKNKILKKKENDKFSDRWRFDGEKLRKLDNSEEWEASDKVPLLVMMVAAGIIKLNK